MKKKPDPKVFREAAELIALGGELYACHAIKQVEGVDCYNSTVNTKFFDKFYRGRYMAMNQAYWTSQEPEGNFTRGRKRGKDVRIFALLLCAEILEQEES
jgi:hypothetical protein